ncbi:MAG TPA: exodeoxyribonuclease VII large subunit [candidate division Zixibacteria bacterium]|nr:exodeoxyribonuclease VII large subunit [candidate division Zixibacteria bacterium]
MQQPQAYTVAAITRIIKDLLEQSLPSVWIEGEISNYVHHSSGHRYFNLKDAHANLRATIWRSAGSALKFEPENGQKVLAFGDITVYEKGGSYQLNCRKLVPVGVGELELAFRQLHEKLTAEGLFEEDRKKPIPAYPRRIGVVTSPTGAAIRDIIQISGRRNPAVELIIYPAKVQGDGAETTIARGIEYFNGRDDIDLLIVGRGGGSLEDLWPFNTEITVRAIAASRLPVISAVGHEVDITLSDLVADLRAPTPSAAAELAVWSLSDTREFVDGNITRQASILSRRVDHARTTLKAQLSRPVFKRPLEMIRQRQQALDYAVQALMTSGKNCFESGRNRLSLAVTKLETLSPLKILSRGYSVSRRLPKHQVLRSTGDILPGDRMETLLSDGEVVSFVESIRKDEKKCRQAKN